MLEVIAILDDDEELLRDIERQLTDFGLFPRTFTSRGEFKKSIERGDHYDALILDWFLEDTESPTMAKLVLNDLKQNAFVPVLIYTDQRYVAEAELPQLPR